MKESYDHELYKKCDEKDADAVAWVFVNKEKMVKFPFKFPEIQPDEVRVNMLYAGLCMSDVHTVRELWGPCSYPIAPGHEIVGEVSLVGKEVKDFKKGDLVGFGTIRQCCDKCEFCKCNRENLCTDYQPQSERWTYGKQWGGYATAMQQPAKFFFHLPKEFKIEKGAPLFCAGITTFYPIQKYLKPEMKYTGVMGCGGLGHMAIQFLHKLGHHVTAFTTSENKTELLKKLGADKVVVSKDPRQMKDAKETIDFMINTIPELIDIDQYVNVIRRGGMWIQNGQPQVDGGYLKINIFAFVCKEINFVGSVVGPRKPTNEMVELCVEKDIYPMVEEFPFDDFPKAFDRLEHGSPKFRVVVNIKDWAEKHGFKK